MTVEIQDAEHKLSQLAESAANGEEVILLRAGEPVARLTPIRVPATQVRKLGMFDGKYEIPDDFDTMFDKEIEEMFYGEPEG